MKILFKLFYILEKFTIKSNKFKCIKVIILF